MCGLTKLSAVVWTTMGGALTGRRSPAAVNNGLMDQSTSGIPLSNKIEDASQGQDEFARQQFKHEVQRDF